MKLMYLFTDQNLNGNKIYAHLILNLENISLKLTNLCIQILSLQHQSYINIYLM